MADSENTRKHEFENKCSVPGCKSVKGGEENITLFAIPKRVRSTPEIRSEWLKIFKLENRSKFPTIFNICEKHFEESDIIKPLDCTDNTKSWATLLPRAVPVKELPDENTPIEELYDNGEEGDSSSDDYPQSREESLEKEVSSVPVTVAAAAPIITTEEQIEEFDDEVEKAEDKKEKENVVAPPEMVPEETPSGMEEENIQTPEEEEKVYHDLKPHITGEEEEEIIPSETIHTTFTPKITNLAEESSKLNEKVAEEKVLKVIKRVAPPRNPTQGEDDEESPTKRPRRNVIHKLIKPRNIKEAIVDSPMKSTPVKKIAPKPEVVVVKKVIKTPLKVVKNVEKTPLKLTTPKPLKVSPKIEKVPVKIVPKPVALKTTVSPKVAIKTTVVPPKVAIKTVVASPKVVTAKATPKVEKKDPEPETNGAAASRSRRNVVHKLIKPRVETPVKEKPTPIKEKSVIISPPKSQAKPKVEIYTSSPTQEITPKKDEKSPKIVMISSKLLQGSPKFVKSPQILKIAGKNIVSPLKVTQPIIVTPKKPTIVAKVAVKRLTSKVIPIEDDSSRPRRNVPHKFIKTTNNGVEKEKEKKVTPQTIIQVATPQKALDPVESMHVALLKEFLSDSKSVQMEVVKKKATSIAKIIGLKGFKASDDWTKKFIAGNLATCNGGSLN